LLQINAPTVGDRIMAKQIEARSRSLRLNNSMGGEKTQAGHPDTPIAVTKIFAIINEEPALCTFWAENAF